MRRVMKSYQRVESLEGKSGHVPFPSPFSWIQALLRMHVLPASPGLSPVLESVSKQHWWLRVSLLTLVLDVRKAFAYRYEPYSPITVAELEMVSFISAIFFVLVLNWFRI